MKKCVFAMLLILLLTMTGCGTTAPNHEELTEKKITVEDEVQSVEKEQENEPAPLEAVPETTFDTKEPLRKYMDAYGAECVYEDLYIPGKYILIGAKQVWIIYIMEGYENSQQMSFDAIARVENKLLGDACFLKIVDKTGTEFSMTLCQNDVAECMARISS